jgi:hypothetical protein
MSNARPIAAILLIVLTGLYQGVRAAEADRPAYFHLHLPGIGGERMIDHLLVRGLRQAGLKARSEIYDWTGPDVGLRALSNASRHQEQARIIAEMLTRQHRAEPQTPILLTGHSAGSGMAVWALEKLEDDVHIQTLVLIAPALSPTYDLSPALRRVSGRAYAITSVHDSVLGTGTRMLGTVDRIRTDAAGRVGFTVPEAPAFPQEYDKLVPVPYEPRFLRLGHVGDHIGAMLSPFARHILAPLILQGRLPEPESNDQAEDADG